MYNLSKIFLLPERACLSLVGGRISRASFFIMEKFIQAVNEYYHLLTIPETSPKIVWLNKKYIVTMYYSESTINRLGGEIVYG